MSVRRLAMLCALSALLGCAGTSDSTTGREVTLRTALRADAELDEPFDTETGWSVRLSKAAVSIGSLYYFEGEPAFVRRRESTLQRLARLLIGPSVARAHPGHYVAGMATGQMTEPLALLLATESAALPDGSGITGLYRSARFGLAEPGADAPPELDGDVAIAEGVATQGERTVHFRLAASFADVSRSVSKGQVNGCVFDEAEVRGDGTVTVTVKPHVWFNLVDFHDVAAGSAGEPTRVPAGDTAQIAFALGVVQLNAYHFSYAQEE